MLSIFLAFTGGAIAVVVAAIFFYQVGFEAGYQKASGGLTDEDNENLFRDITRKGDFDGRY